MVMENYSLIEFSDAWKCEFGYGHVFQEDGNVLEILGSLYRLYSAEWGEVGI